MLLSEQENFNIIRDLTNRDATSKLRVFFIYLWFQKLDKKWINSTDNVRELIESIDKLAYEHFDSYQKKLINNENIEKWDLSLIILIFYHAELYQEDNFIKYIKKLRYIRNKVNHPSTHKINNKEYNHYKKEINNVLNYINNYYENHKKVENIKNKGNNYVKEKNFSEAINLYSEAIIVQYLDNKILAKLYCNRSYCYFKQELYDNALQDSNLSINLYPNWYKPYFRKAQIYKSIKKFYKSKKTLEKALSINPENKEIKKELDIVTKIVNENKNIDIDDAINVLQDFLIEINKNDDQIKEKDVIVEINYNYNLSLNKEIVYGQDFTKKISIKPYKVYLSKLWNIYNIFGLRREKNDYIKIINNIAYNYDEDKNELSEISFRLGDEECVKVINYFNIKTGGNYLHLSEIYDIYINAIEDVYKFDINENKVIFCKDNVFIIRDDNKIEIEAKYYYLKFIKNNDEDFPILVNEKIIKYINSWDNISDNEKDIYEYINLISNKEIKLVEGNQIKIYKNNKRYDIDFVALSQSLTDT